MTVDDAFQRFRISALSRGLSDVDERAHPEAFGSRISTLRQDAAALRLVWDGKEETLRLEITHGPDSPTGWLDLYGASRSGDQLPPTRRTWDSSPPLSTGSSSWILSMTWVPHNPPQHTDAELHRLARLLVSVYFAIINGRAARRG